VWGSNVLFSESAAQAESIAKGDGSKGDHVKKTDK